MAAVNPYQSLAANIYAYVIGKTRFGPRSWGLNALSPIVLANDVTVAAGQADTAIIASIILPQATKIPKVAIGYKAVDLFNGTEFLNIIVESAGSYNPNASVPNNNANFNTTANPFGQSAGYGGSWTANQVQTVGPSDNSESPGPGYPTQFAAIGNCLFGTDINFGPTFFSNGSAGTGGGAGVFPTTNWDTVYAPGTILSLRATTTASTGSITGLVVTLLTQTVDILPSNDRSIPCYAW